MNLNSILVSVVKALTWIVCLESDTVYELIRYYSLPTYFFGLGTRPTILMHLWYYYDDIKIKHLWNNRTRIVQDTIRHWIWLFFFPNLTSYKLRLLQYCFWDFHRAKVSADKNFCSLTRALFLRILFCLYHSCWTCEGIAFTELHSTYRLPS